MGTATFSDDFKRDAVAQITERGYPVSEVSERLGVSKHSLYAWKRKFAKTASGEAEKDAEIFDVLGLSAREVTAPGCCATCKPRVSRCWK